MYAFSLLWTVTKRHFCAFPQKFLRNFCANHCEMAMARYILNGAWHFGIKLHKKCGWPRPSQKIACHGVLAVDSLTLSGLSQQEASVRAARVNPACLVRTWIEDIQPTKPHRTILKPLARAATVWPNTRTSYPVHA